MLPQTSQSESETSMAPSQSSSMPFSQASAAPGWTASEDSLQSAGSPSSPVSPGSQLSWPSASESLHPPPQSGSAASTRPSQLLSTPSPQSVSRGWAGVALGSASLQSPAQGLQPSPSTSR